jgi:cell division protein FtsW
MLKLKEKNYDYTLLVVTLVLVMLGIVMVYSSSFYYAENNPNYNDGLFFFKKQIQGALIGIAVMIFTMFWDYKRYKSFKYIGIVAAVVLLSLVFIPGIGIKINQSSRWIQLAGIRFQPSEVAKALLIISVAKILNDNQDHLEKIHYSILHVLFITAIVCVPIALQPNYSAVLIICGIVFVMMFAGGVKKTYLFGFIMIGIIAGTFAALKEPHLLARFEGFLNTEADARGKGYQILQSLYAIGSGGAFGRGIGNSMQKFLYLPYGESDFIFAIVCEELGFFGATIIMGLFFILIYRGVKTALKAPDVFGMLLATGITMTLAIQVILNIAVVSKVMPVTGVLLPFISAGSTALIIFLAEIGILLNISHQGNKL